MFHILEDDPRCRFAGRGLLLSSVIVVRAWGLRSLGKEDAFPASLVLTCTPVICAGIGLLGARP